MPKPGIQPGAKDVVEKEDAVAGSYTSLPAADVEIAHGLGRIPKFVILTTKSTGVVAQPLLVSKSATSIIIRAETSGVDLEYLIRL